MPRVNTMEGEANGEEGGEKSGAGNIILKDVDWEGEVVDAGAAMEEVDEELTGGLGIKQVSKQVITRIW